MDQNVAALFKESGSSGNSGGQIPVSPLEGIPDLTRGGEWSKNACDAPSLHRQRRSRVSRFDEIAWEPSLRDAESVTRELSLRLGAVCVESSGGGSTQTALLVLFPVELKRDLLVVIARFLNRAIQ